jgi:hypothetical protein
MDSGGGSEAPLVTLNQAALDAKGFTNSGSQRFQSTVQDYAQQLLQRAVLFGEADKAAGMAAEVTHEHIRASALSISRSFGRPTQSKWLIAAQVGEYVATAAGGVGAGHLDKPWGIINFALGVSIAVILVVVRLTQGKGE